MNEKIVILKTNLQRTVPLVSVSPSVHLYHYLPLREADLWILKIAHILLKTFLYVKVFLCMQGICVLCFMLFGR